MGGRALRSPALEPNACPYGPLQAIVHADGAALADRASPTRIRTPSRPADAGLFLLRSVPTTISVCSILPRPVRRLPPVTADLSLTDRFLQIMSLAAAAEAELLDQLSHLPKDQNPYLAIAAALRDKLFPTVPDSAIYQLYLVAAGLGAHVRPSLASYGLY